MSYTMPNDDPQNVKYRICEDVYTGQTGKSSSEKVNHCKYSISKAQESPVGRKQRILTD